jgi:tyrosine-specific transport protein
MDFKLLGSILLIVGTSIGAGMLALPLATAQLGFVGSLILLVSCWFVMTIGALLILEVNLWLPQNSNLISMAKATIGPIGQLVAWITYVLLLYSLLCAYIAGGSDLFHNLLHASGMSMPFWLTALIFVSLFGAIVYGGIRAVDYANRGLMFFKLGGYLLLIFFITPFISLDKLADGNLASITSVAAIMVTITAFGYAAIVPSLRVYFAGDIKKLKIAIFIGSLIPLICYIIWDAAIMGIIPLSGAQSLATIMQSKNATSELVNVLNSIVARDSVAFFAKLFTSICVITSFLGVGICLTDFLADGLQLEKKGKSNLLIFSLTFVPPLVIVLFLPNIFVQALTYAGIYCVVLLILLPAWMAWAGRYRRRLAGSYTVWGGKTLLGLLMIFSLVLTMYGLKV